MTRIAVLGAGKIGEALLSGLLAAGSTAGDLVFTERHPERAAELSDRLGVAAVGMAEAAAHAELIVVAVKPQDIAPVLAELAPVLRPGHAGGVAVRGAADRAVRGRAAGRHAGGAGHAEHPDAGRRGDERDLRGLARRRRRSWPWWRRCWPRSAGWCGCRRAQQDAVTALSGSGPAYFFFLVEAMIDAGILLGLPRAVAADLIVQSAFGAAAMLRESSDHPVILREAVTSPGGHHDRGHPRAGETRRPGGPDRRHRGGPRPLGRAGPGGRAALTPRSGESLHPDATGRGHPRVTRSVEHVTAVPLSSPGEHQDRGPPSAPAARPDETTKAVIGCRLSFPRSTSPRCSS